MRPTLLHTSFFMKWNCNAVWGRGLLHPLGVIISYASKSTSETESAFWTMWWSWDWPLQIPSTFVILTSSSLRAGPWWWCGRTSGRRRWSRSCSIWLPGGACQMIRSCGGDLSLVDKHAKEACPVALSQKKKSCTNIANRAGVKKSAGVIFCAVVENIWTDAI